MARKPKALAEAPSELEGKKGSEPAIIRWVARHIDHPCPDPASCPDPFAWTLLRQCRADVVFRGFFIEKLWGKLVPSRAQIDEGATKALDGKPTLELIERILEMRDEAVESSAPVASQDQEPEEAPDVFGDFDPEED